MVKITDMTIDEISNLKKEDIYMELFGFSRPTYYKWKREENLALRLIESNFSDEDLIDFIINKNNSSHQYKTIENLLVDNAIFSAKEKYEKYEKYLYGDIFDNANNYGAREILKELMPNIKDEHYSIENAKDILLDRIKGYEAKWLSLKNPQKAKLLSKILAKRFSKIEIYAMCKYNENIFEI